MNNSKTTLGTIFTVIGLIPQALTHFQIADAPAWLSTVGIVCSLVAFIYTGVVSADANKD